MEAGCFIALLVIEFFVMQISDKLSDIRDSKEGADNDT